jgi:hypothetical protein
MSDKKTDTVQLAANVRLWSIGQLEAAFDLSEEESVFAWLRKLVESNPVLMTSDRGIMCKRAGLH